MAYFSCFFRWWGSGGRRLRRSSPHTEINWTRLVGRDHTCHVRFRQRDPRAECKAPSNYGKVVKAPALPLGICVWYPPGKQQAVGNLRPPLPLRRKPAWRANCRPNTRRPVALLSGSSAGLANLHKAAELRHFFFFFLFIIALIQSTTSKAEREIGLEKVTRRRNFLRSTQSTSGG